MGYVSRRRAGRAAAKGHVPGLPPSRVPRFGAPGPRKPSPEPRAPSPDLFSVLPRRPGARAGVAVGAQSQHRVRGAFSGFASIRAGQSRTPRAPARGTLDCARRVEERRRSVCRPAAPGADRRASRARPGCRRPAVARCSTIRFVTALPSVAAIRRSRACMPPMAAIAVSHGIETGRFMNKLRRGTIRSVERRCDCGANGPSTSSAE